MTGFYGTEDKNLILENNKGDKVTVKNDGTLKSDFFIEAEDVKVKLNAVSPSFCLAKWTQVSLHLGTGMTNSCYHPPLHKIDNIAIKTNPAALHNTDHKKKMRKLMMIGNRPSECSYCWAMEDTNHLSDRHYRSSEPWSQIDFQKILDNPYADINPRYVEINFNNNCNLKCSYCSPQFSTTWAKESKKYGAWPTSNKHNAPEYFIGDKKCIPNKDYNPYIEAFWKWWPELYSDLKHLRLTGGEPLMDKNTNKILDYVIDNPKTDLHLNTTSNFSPPTQQLFINYLKKVKLICVEEKVEHFMQYISVDTWGKQAEYIRDGLDFNVLWDNANKFLFDIPYRSSITFIITYNNLSITNLKQLLEGILELRKIYSTTYQRIWFDTPLLRKPAWQSIQIMPDSYKLIHQKNIQYMQEHLETKNTRFHGFKDYEIQRMTRDLALWNKDNFTNKELIQHKIDFYKFFNEHDKRRDTDFLKTFPEMIEWWNECKMLEQKKGDS